MPPSDDDTYHRDSDGFPVTGSIWRHHSGHLYVILMMTNTEEGRQDDFPTTVSYQSHATGKRYSQALTRFNTKFRPEK